MSGRPPAPGGPAPARPSPARGESEPSAKHAHSLVLVSDLHMASGRDPATGRPARTEDFARDSAFASFLRARAAAQTELGRPWRLVTLGDLFDFARVELGGPGEDRRRLDTSTGAALAKLDRIAAGHPEVFDALRELVAAGVPIDVVPGNHDLEIARPAVQRRLRELLVGPGLSGRDWIEFHPRIFYMPGVLYAEHGHHHHDINTTPQLWRYSEAGEGEVLEAPLGSELGEYITRLLEAAEPGTERLDPDLARLVAALRARPAAGIVTWRAHLRFARALGRQAVRVGRAAVMSRRATAGEDGRSGTAAADTALTHGSLAGLDRLAIATLANTFSRLSGMAVASRASRRGRPPEPPPPGYMHRAAAAVHRILRDHGDQVPLYVFAHTHAAERSGLGPAGTEATYLNTGTWSELVRGDAARLTFVEIEVEPNTPPAAALLTWDPTRGQAMPVEPAGPDRG